MNFATQAFRQRHGFQPRGMALWTFYFSDEPDVAWRPSPVLLSYTDAKALAVTEARRRSVTAVRVDPNPASLQLYSEDT